jgi:hypothetical protein
VTGPLLRVDANHLVSRRITVFLFPWR